MASFNELRTKYTNRDQGYERKAGYYYCSEVNKMRPKSRFKLTPKNFFEKRDIEEIGSSRIERGNAYEAHFERMLVASKTPHRYEPKKYCVINTETLAEVWTLVNDEKPEIKENELCLTVKPDFVFPNRIIETKAPERPPTSVPEYYKDQLCAEQQAFGLPTYLGVFVAPFDLITHRYEPELTRWKEIKIIVRDFHAKLKTLKK